MGEPVLPLGELYNLPGRICEEIVGKLFVWEMKGIAYVCSFFEF